MVLLIDTTDPESAHLVLVLNNKKKFAHKFQVERNLSERLVPEIQKCRKKLLIFRYRKNCRHHRPGAVFQNSHGSRHSECLGLWVRYSSGRGEACRKK